MDKEKLAQLLQASQVRKCFLFLLFSLSLLLVVVVVARLCLFLPVNAHTVEEVNLGQKQGWDALTKEKIFY